MTYGEMSVRFEKCIGFLKFFNMKSFTIKSAGALLILGMFGVASCDKSLDDPSMSSFDGEDIRKSSKPCYELTLIEIDSIGIIHNDLLEESISEYKDYSCNSEAICRSELLDFFKSLDFDSSPIGYTLEEIVIKTDSMFKVTKAWDHDIRQIPVHQWSNKAQNLLVSIYDIADTVSHFSVYKEEMSKIIETKLDLDCFETNLIKATASIAIYSSYFWMPIENGGLGNEMPDNFGKAKAWSWRNAFYGDVAASFSYFTVIGIGGCITAAVIPGTNVALFTGWGLSAGIGSAMAGAVF